MKKNIAILIIACVASFFVGRSFTDVEYSVKLVKGPTVKVEVPVEKLVPAKVTKADTTKYVNPKETDSTDQPIITATPSNIDSAMVATVNDWNLKRMYQGTLFDDDKGKLDYTASVQYNQLIGLSHEFTPIQKETTKIRARSVVPFISSEASSLGTWRIGGGIFNNNAGIQAHYERSLKTGDKGFSIGLIYKFE